MNDQQIKNTIRDFLKAWTAGDISKAVSFFTENSCWENPQGTFKGIAQIEKYLIWVIKSNKDYKVTENGIGIIAQEDAAVIEHELSGIYDGEKWSSPAVCVWEFKDDKIANLRTYVDTLSQAQQLAKGPVEKLAVNSLIKATREGL